MANRFQSLIDGEEEKKKPVININPSNGGNRFGDLLEQPTSQPINQPSQVANKPEFNFKFRPAHSPSQPVQSEEPNYGVAFARGTLGSLAGRAITPIFEKITGKEVDLSTLPESNTFGEKALEMGSNLVTDLPLWLAGDVALVKPLGALAKTAPVSKALNIVPKAIKPALGTGVRAGATYGGIIAPAETLVEGDGLEGLIEREKQVPMMALGGTALHGAGALIGKGIKSGIDYAKFNKLTKIPEMKSNPLQDVQNAYKAPALRDAQANQLNKTFQDTSNLMSPVQLKTLQQSIDDAVGIKKPLPTELVRQRKADVKSALSLRPGTEVPLPQRNLPKTAKPLTWTNKEGIANSGNPPIKSITEENLGQLPSRQGSIPLQNNGNATMPISQGNGTLSQVKNAESPSIATSNSTTKKDFPQGEIPTGQKERGFSGNTRTDVNNPDALRNSYTDKPLTYEQLGNPATLAKAQAIFDQGTESAITQLSELASRMQPEAIPLAKLLSRQATEAGNINGAREIISTVAEKLTQAGQFSQAARILREADPETFIMTIGKQLKKLNQEGLETYGKKWKNFDLTPDELAMVGKIERGNQKAYEDAFEQIQARIANEMPASAMEKINAWRHISMLLNPKTHIRNVGGNAIMMGMRKIAQRVSGTIQKVALKESDRTQSVFVNKEYKDLAKNYFEANKKDLLSGANKYQDNVSVSMPDKRVFRKSRIGEKFGVDIDLMEKVRKFNYALLQKGDNPFFQKAYIDRLASFAQAKGIKDFSKLSKEAFDTARLEAEQATYKDASFIADFINKAKRPAKDASLGRKTGALLTEAALPFTKTPINIIKRGIQYSPIGIANGLAGIKSSKGAATAIDEMAKGLSGTGVLGLGYLLASKGILTGKSEKDVDLREYNKNIGQAPFSVLGKYSFDWAVPLAVPLSVGVEIYNAIKDKPEDIAKMNKLIEDNDTSKLQEMALTISRGIMEGLNASGDTVFNMSIMRGIKTLLGSGTKSFMEGLAQLPQGYATQFIPTVSNQLAGTIDPLVRQTYVKGNLPESFKNALVARIPGASTTLEPKQTPFGEDVKKIENPLGRTASQFLSPGIVAKDQNIDPKIDSELRRLNELGFTEQFPTMVPNYIPKTQTHPKIELSPEETTQYQKRVGQLTLKSFNKVMNDSSYKYARDDRKKNKSADEIKADLLAKAISEAKTIAKKEMLKSKGLK